MLGAVEHLLINMNDVGYLVKFQILWDMVLIMTLQFKEMYTVIHIEEKWLHNSRCRQNCYLVIHEDNPYRSTQKKLHREGE